MAHASNQKFAEVCDILDRHDHQASQLIPILQEIQAAYGYLPEDIMTYISTALNISPSQVYGVATFFTHFTLTPKGRHVIKVCDGTACHVNKSQAILDTIVEHLRLSDKKTTTDDGMFTLETVACLGACGLAPVIVIDEKAHGQMTPESTIALLDSMREAEETDSE
ncbi:MAG: NADH-quinone oxidoreductase subunit NuoE [Saccharofermentanales bacterium]|jgi:NADH-quinone oxidoreductase subunit E